MLSPKQIALLREELTTAKNPLFVYDSDRDGLCSFLLLYRFHPEGKGIPLTASPLNKDMLKKVEELQPDKIFILDIHTVDQEFLDAVKRPVFWIDHHKPQERTNVHYFNPRIKDPEMYLPTSYMAYQVTQQEKDLWIAVLGCLADWHFPDFMDKFIEQYPHLVSTKTDLPTTVYKEPMSALLKLFSFMLKGPSAEVRKSIKILTRISSPDEIMKQETPAGKFLYKRYEAINKKYQTLLATARQQASKQKILLFQYAEDMWSFTQGLADELTNLYPQKVIIVARKKSGTYKCSLRAQFPIEELLQKALAGINGYGGGHPQACGAVIKEEDWDRFLERFKEEIGKG